MATLQTTELKVLGMDCVSCAQKISASLQQLPGVTETQVRFATGRLSASFDPLQVNEAAIRDRITALGYTVELAPANKERLRVRAASKMLPQSNRMKTALRLESITVVWMVIEAAGAIEAGIAAGSLLLIAFGIDSVIELISASVLFWRLQKEARGGASNASIERVERRASRISGYLLYALSGYVLLQAIYGLTHKHHAETSFLGITVAVVAALGMPLLAKAKMRVADEIGSKALRADAMETFTCGYLSWVLLAGLAANSLLHWWWLDAAASLVVVPLLLKEAQEAMTGECDCD